MTLVMASRSSCGGTGALRLEGKRGSGRTGGVGGGRLTGLFLSGSARPPPKRRSFVGPERERQPRLLRALGAVNDGQALHEQLAEQLQNLKGSDEVLLAEKALNLVERDRA